MFEVLEPLVVWVLGCLKIESEIKTKVTLDI